MGLLFALQPFEQKSTPTRLYLRSHFRRFAMGGSFIFAGLFLGVMTLAAFPLFKLMLEEGSWFDYLIVGFFATVLTLYPILAALCFLFEEHVTLDKQANGLYKLTRYRKILFFKWGYRTLENFKLSDIQEENWVGALNSAALKAKKKAVPNRYATKGHWMLILKDNNGDDFVIERRAKKEEIEWLKFLIEKHFHIAI
jgi:hypothetical protein